MRSLSIISVIAMLLSACMTPGEKKTIKNDLFDAQARLLKLEQQLNMSTKDIKDSGNEANKRLANTQASMESMSRDIQVMKGEVDTLRIGVITGQLPGLSEESRESSIAATLQRMSERLDSVEKSQEELLAALKSAGLKKKTPKRRAPSSVSSIKKAFDKKQYSSVVADAPTLIKKSKGEDKEEASYLYAESLFKLGKLRDAALKYNDFIESRPSTRYLPAAKMRMGDCFRHLGDSDTAFLYYNELIKEFPDTDEATKAREHVAKISGTTNKG